MSRYPNSYITRKNRIMNEKKFNVLYSVPCYICRPSDFSVSEDAGIEPGTVATLALAVRRSYNSARDLIHI